MRRAADKAARVDVAWIEAAVEHIRRFAKAHPDATYTIEKARTGVALPANVDGRVWGAVTRLSVSRGYLKRVPGGYAPAASSNTSMKPLYRKGDEA